MREEEDISLANVSWTRSSTVCGSLILAPTTRRSTWDEVDQGALVVRRLVTAPHGIGRHRVLLPAGKQELRPLG